MSLDNYGISRRRRRMENQDDNVLQNENFIEIPLNEPNGLVAFPGKSLFGVMQDKCVFSLIDPVTGMIARNFKLNLPKDLEAYNPTDIATDGTESVFFTASCYGHDSTNDWLSRRIYRFWLEESVATELFLFAQSSSLHNYKGIVYSEYWSCVLTTEETKIVALSTASLVRSELSQKVFEVYIGPEPYVHAINQSSGNSASLICSSELNLVNKIIGKKKDVYEVTKEQRWSEHGHEALKTAWPHLITLWNGRALISKGYWLKVFSNFPNDPIYIGAFAPPYSSQCPLEMSTSIAALRYHDASANREKDVALLLNPSSMAILVPVPQASDDERFSN